MDVQQRDDAVPFITEDGSEIRELLSHRNSSIRNQSLAEATLTHGQSTQAHYHPVAEEIYFVLTGLGLMRLQNERRRVRVGDAIAIPPGESHQITNIGDEDLVFLCCCAPGYEPEDIVFIEWD